MTVAGQQLRSFVERVERLDEEIKCIQDDKRDVYAEAKASGFDVRALKVVIRRRAMDSNELFEHDSLVETYESALGTRRATHAGAREAAE